MNEHCSHLQRVPGLRPLLTILCLLLALPVLGVLGAWLTLDDAALAVLRHQWQTVLPDYAWQSTLLAGGVGLGVMLYLLFDKLLDVVLPTGLLSFIFGGR